MVFFIITGVGPLGVGLDTEEGGGAMVAFCGALVGSAEPLLDDGVGFFDEGADPVGIFALEGGGTGPAFLPPTRLVAVRGVTRSSSEGVREITGWTVPNAGSASVSLSGCAAVDVSSASASRKM